MNLSIPIDFRITVDLGTFVNHGIAVNLAFPLPRGARLYADPQRYSIR